MSAGVTSLMEKTATVRKPQVRRDGQPQKEPVAVPPVVPAVQKTADDLAQEAAALAASITREVKKFVRGSPIKVCYEGGIVYSSVLKRDLVAAEETIYLADGDGVIICRKGEWVLRNPRGRMIPITSISSNGH